MDGIKVDLDWGFVLPVCYAGCSFNTETYAEYRIRRRIRFTRSNDILMLLYKKYGSFRYIVRKK